MRYNRIISYGRGTLPQLIEAYKELGSSYDKAKSFIVEKYQLSTSEAEAKMQEYWEN